MKILILIVSGIFLIQTAFAQVSVFDCQALPETITQAMINSSPDFYRPCVTLGGEEAINMTGLTPYKVVAAKEITLKDGFHAGGFDSNGSAWFKIEPQQNAFDVAVMNYGDLLHVQKLKKMELGVKLNSLIQDKINNFTEKVNVSSSQKINPYLDWEIRVVATFSKDGMSDPIEIDGFYSRDFEVWQQYPLPAPNNWHIGYSDAEYQSLGGWTDLHSPYTFRLRFAPPQSGHWKSSVKVVVAGAVAYESPEFYFNVDDSNNEGYVYAGKRYMLRDGKTFFPVGINLPWPETHDKFDVELSDNMTTTDTWSYPDSTIVYLTTEGHRHNYCAPRVYDSYRNLMTQLSQGGANYMRTIMNPISTDIEYEELGNYTDRLPMAHEMDKILTHAEDLGLLIHWNMAIHYTFQMMGVTSYHRFWTWDDTVKGNPFAYASIVGPDPVDFLTHAEAKKYYKQRYRYILARWGYSPNIAVLELFSEISNVGSELPDNSFFYRQGNNWQMYRDWQVEMAEYIKSHYHGKIHALTSSYAGRKVPQDNTFDSPYFDLMTVNVYDFQEPGFAEELIKETAQSIFNNLHEDSYTKNTIKPIMFSETDAVEASCDDKYVEVIRAQWERLYSGLAGSFSWVMMYKPELFPVLGQMRLAMNGIELERDRWHPGASDLVESLRGPEWEYNDSYAEDMDGKIKYNLFEKPKDRKADLIYLRSADRNFAAGVTTNKTFNIYNQGNGCFNSGGYTVPDEYKNSLTVNTEDVKLKLRNMRLDRYYVNYFIPSNQSVPVNSSDELGQKVKISDVIYGSLDHYVRVVKARRTNYNWLETRAVVDNAVLKNELDTAQSDSGVLSLGDEQIRYSDIEVFPNPFNERVTIKHSFDEKIVAELLNIDGKSIKKYTISDYETILDVSGISEGIYILQLQSDNQVLKQIKLRKQ